MNKNYFLILFLSICFLCNAQVKTYEYPSQILTEEGIEKLVYQSKQSGASESELRLFRRLLQNKMYQQKNNSATSQKNGDLILNSSACSNSDFENGTNSGWSFSSADINGVALPCNTCPGGTSAINAIVNSVSTVAGQCTNGVDIYGNFPVVAPGGGTWSMVLNDANYMGKMQEATFTFNVDAASTIFTYQYAAVLNSGGHAATANPYFYVGVINNTTGNVVSCTEYTTSAPASGTLPGWIISPTCGGNACNAVYYKPWTTVSVDLSFAIGQSVTLKFIVSDCANGGHFGYVYLDASCNPFSTNNIAGICSGNPANLCGPPGFATYNWSGPVTDSVECLSTLTSGTYTLNMTSVSGCPVQSSTYTVITSSNPSPSVTISGVDSTCLNQNGYLYGHGAATYTWNSNAGLYIGDSILISPTGYTTFSVVGMDTVGCTNSATHDVSLKVDPNVVASVSPGNSVCPGTSVTINATGASSYVISNGISNGVAFTPTATANYFITGTGSNGCTDTASVNVSIISNAAVSYTITPDTTATSTWNVYPYYSSGITSAVWYWGDGTSSTGLSPSHVYSSAGWYNVCVTAFSTCGDSAQYCLNDSLYRGSSSMVYVNVKGSSSVNYVSAVKGQLKLFPNPATNMVTVQSEEKLGVILIYNSIGEIVLQTQSNSMKTEIDLSKLPMGVYTIKTQNKYLRLVKE